MTFRNPAVLFHAQDRELYEFANRIIRQPVNLNPHSTLTEIKSLFPNQQQLFDYENKEYTWQPKAEILKGFKKSDIFSVIDFYPIQTSVNIETLVEFFKEHGNYLDEELDSNKAENKLKERINNLKAQGKTTENSIALRKAYHALGKINELKQVLHDIEKLINKNETTTDRFRNAVRVCDASNLGYFFFGLSLGGQGAQTGANVAGYTLSTSTAQYIGGAPAVLDILTYVLMISTALAAIKLLHRWVEFRKKSLPTHIRDFYTFAKNNPRKAANLIAFELMMFTHNFHSMMTVLYGFMDKLSLPVNIVLSLIIAFIGEIYMELFSGELTRRNWPRLTNLSEMKEFIKNHDLSTLFNFGIQTGGSIISTAYLYFFLGTSTAAALSVPAPGTLINGVLTALAAGIRTAAVYNFMSLDYYNDPRKKLLNTAMKLAKRLSGQEEVTPELEAKAIEIANHARTEALQEQGKIKLLKSQGIGLGQLAMRSVIFFALIAKVVNMPNIGNIFILFSVLLATFAGTKAHISRGQFQAAEFKLKAQLKEKQPQQVAEEKKPTNINCRAILSFSLAALLSTACSGLAVLTTLGAFDIKIDTLQLAALIVILDQFPLNFGFFFPSVYQNLSTLFSRSRAEEKNSDVAVNANELQPGRHPIFEIVRDQLPINLGLTFPRTYQNSPHLFARSRKTEHSTTDEKCPEVVININEQKPGDLHAPTHPRLELQTAPRLA